MIRPTSSPYGRFASVFVLTLVFSAIAACAVPAAREGQSGTDRLDPKAAAEIDKVFAAYEKPGRPGCVVGVLRDGEVVYTRGYGRADLEHNVPAAPETIFELGSVSKQFTAAAVLALASQGKLSLDDDIRKHLPDIPDFGSVITIRHLLHHTSGLRDQWGLLDFEGRPAGTVVHTMGEILDLVSRQKDLNFRPGDEYLYSNTNYSLLAWIVRRAGGRSLADFSRDVIFEPLGMSHTQWRDDFRRVVPGRAQAYSGGPKATFLLDMPFTDVYGNGGLLTTVGDLLTWAENFWNPRILGRELLDEMQTPGRLNDRTPIAYAMGLGVSEYRGLRQVTHGGSTAGYRAYLVRYPAEHTAVAILSSYAGTDPGDLAHKVTDILLADRLGEKPTVRPVKLTPERLGELAGLYRDGQTDAILRLSVKDGGLAIEGGRARKLLPVASDRFLMENGTACDFDRSADGTVTMREVPQADRPSTYTRVEQVRPDPDELREYEGRYWSDELDVTYAVAMDNGRLTVRLRPEPALPLEPTYKDGFSPRGSGGISLRFTRNAAGEVDGFLISSGRVRHLKFVRR